MNSSVIREAKSGLRSLMKQRLSALSQASIASQSQLTREKMARRQTDLATGQQVFKTLTEFKPYVNARKVAVYLSMPTGEVQTDAIVRHALSSGKQVYVPYLHGSGLPTGDGPTRVMDMVALKDIVDYESLQKDKWGIPSVDSATVNERQRIMGELDGSNSSEASLDIIFLPGVAFDLDPTSSAVRRLGHGKGFYDYFLHRYALAASEANRATGGRPVVQLYSLALKEQYLSRGSEVSVPVGPHDQSVDGVIVGDGNIIESTVPQSNTGKGRQARD